MWKVTREQYSDISYQEGKKLYDKEIDLGKDEKGIPILTMTHSSDLEFNTPSNSYLETIINGIRETYQFDDKTILSYLMKTPGINGNLQEEDVISILQKTESF